VSVRACVYMYLCVACMFCFWVCVCVSVRACVYMYLCVACMFCFWMCLYVCVCVPAGARDVRVVTLCLLRKEGVFIRIYERAAGKALDSCLKGGNLTTLLLAVCMCVHGSVCAYVAVCVHGCVRTWLYVCMHKHACCLLERVCPSNCYHHQAWISGQNPLCCAGASIQVLAHTHIHIRTHACTHRTWRS